MSNFAFRHPKADEKTGVNELVNEDFRRSFGDASKQKCHFATEPKEHKAKQFLTGLKI